MPASRPLAVCSAALLAAFSALSLNAQSVTTTPVGAMVYSFPATGSSPATNTTYLSIPLKSPIYSNAVSSVAANSVTVANATFAANELAQNGAPNFLRITSGVQAGRTLLITANTTDTITVDVTDGTNQTTNLTHSGWAVTAGDKFEIILGDTIASLFGDNSIDKPLVFEGNAFSFLADSIGLFNRSTSRFDVYHFNTTNNFWRPSLTATNSNNVVIAPNQPVLVVRRTNRPATSLTVTGEVPTIPTLVKTTGNGVAVYASTGYPVSMTLGQLQIPSFTEGTFSFLADRIGLFNPSTTRFDSYYKRSDLATNDWRTSLDSITDQSGKVVDHSGVVLVIKSGAVSGASSFVQLPLPYSL